MKKTRYFEKEYKHITGLLFYVTSNLLVKRFNLRGTKTTADFSGLIFNLLTLHHFFEIV